MKNVLNSYFLYDEYIKIFKKFSVKKKKKTKIKSNLTKF